MHLMISLALLGAVAFGLALGALCYAEAHPARAEQMTDAIIVLGAQVYETGELSPQLESRMEAALDAYWENPRLIITTGAQGANEPAPEGQVMREWLLARGVPEGDVAAEVDSYNTWQNIEHSKALLPPGAQSVTIITSDYHLPRALAIAGDLGLNAEGIGSPCKPEYWLRNHAREVLAWGKYFAAKVIPSLN